MQLALTVPCMIDRAMQALYLLALAPISETSADPHSYGFRPERATADAIEQCFNVLSNRYAPQWILEGDIEGCFDNISHDWLVAHVPLDKAILRKWLKAGYIENRQLFPTETGTPQGGIISPALSNWALDGLQKRLEQVCGKARNVDGKRIGVKMNFIRYADDFVVLVAGTRTQAEKLRDQVAAVLSPMGLRLSEEKTGICHIDEGFTFLGWRIQRQTMVGTKSKRFVYTWPSKLRRLLPP